MARYIHYICYINTNNMTSIEWLEERFQMYLSWYEGHHSAKEYKLEDFAKDFQQAKEMHKQEIMDVFEEGYNRAAKVIEDAVQRIIKNNI